MTRFVLCILTVLVSILSRNEGSTLSSGPKRVKYSDFHLMEEQIPRTSFIKGERSPNDHLHQVTIAIHQNNIPELKQMVIDRATPGNPLYQKWFSFDEIGGIVKNEEAYNKVVEWLNENEVEITWSAPHKEYIKATAPISAWETMLKTEFYQFKDTSHPEEHVIHRALHYSIPMELKEHVDAVFHTVQTPPRFQKHFQHVLMKSQREKASGKLPYKTNLRVENVNGGKVTVSFINSLYHIQSNEGSADVQQSVFETGNQYMNPADLTTFQAKNGLTVQAAINRGGHTTNSCDDGNCDEGNLDIQYIMGIAQKTASIFWYVSPAHDPFITWIEDVVGEANPPQSNSISWGEFETAISKSTADQWETEAAKLAGRGVTIAVSSGDHGAPNSHNGDCLCKGVSGSTGYNPSFPATSGFVTAVGATQGPEVGDDEIACQSQAGGLITTGGGFSYYISRPSYQENALNYYFNTAIAGNAPASGYNTGGRGLPDVSLIGVNYEIIINGDEAQVFGTSASAPVFAGFVSLVNAARLAAGRSSIGFLNPTMYAVGHNNTLGLGTIGNSRFNDITSGNNRCCASVDPSDAVCCSTGFTAVKGWDPVTGWGSINFPDFAATFETAAAYTAPTSGAGRTATKQFLPGAMIAITLAVFIELFDHFVTNFHF